MEKMDDSIVAETKRTNGRPRKHADAATRQKAYRARLKAAGMREVKVMVRDVRNADMPLVSDIIDLSQAQKRKRK